MYNINKIKEQLNILATLYGYNIYNSSKKFFKKDIIDFLKKLDCFNISVSHSVAGVFTDYTILSKDDSFIGHRFIITINQCNKFSIPECDIYKDYIHKYNLISTDNFSEFLYTYLIKLKTITL